MKNVDIGIKTKDLKKIAVDVGAKCVHGVKVGDFACPDCLKIYGKKSVKKIMECESCGFVITDKSKLNVLFWTNPNGRVICDNCINKPLDILSKVFYSKDFVKAKKIIREFDEECDNSFLNIEYI